MHDVLIAPTMSRSVLGSINDFAYMAEVHLRAEPTLDLQSLALKLARAIPPRWSHGRDRRRAARRPTAEHPARCDPDGPRPGHPTHRPRGRYTPHMPDPQDAVEVPYDRLAPDTLRRVAEEFVTRDGTDYGWVEKTLEEKVERLLSLLQRGEARLYYEIASGSINIVTAEGRR